MSVFMLVANTVFASGRAVLLNPAADGKYEAIEIKGDADTRYIPQDINNRCQVVGYSIAPGGYYQAFLWSKSTGVKDLRTLYCDEESAPDKASIARGINDSGQIVGDSFPEPYKTGRAFSFCANFHENTEIEKFANASGVNNDGIVCGSGQLYDESYALARLDIESKDRNLSRINEEGFHSARAINNSGQIVGISKRQAFLWSKYEGIEQLGGLPGDAVSSATAINDKGDVVGWSRNLNLSRDRAFLWSADTGMKELPPLYPGDNANAYGINDSAIVVGSSGQRAVIWINEIPFDLNHLIQGTDLGYTLTHARAINDKGQIIAYSNGRVSYPARGEQPLAAIEIATADDWDNLANTPRAWDRHITLASDIDFDGRTITPIGTSKEQFTGVFDGNGYVISNFTAGTAGQDWSGLFGYVGDDGEVRNLETKYSFVDGAGESIDLNSDGFVNFADFTIFAKHWLRNDCQKPDWCGGADLGRSGSVGVEDLVILSESWLLPVHSVLGDLDGDGFVSFTDFTIFAKHWLRNDCQESDRCGGSDFSRSGSVGIEDLVIFSKSWLQWVGSPLGDLSGDRSVNFVDFTMFAGHWLRDDCREPDWCGGADFDRTGSVDIEDLAVLGGNWLKGY